MAVGVVSREQRRAPATGKPLGKLGAKKNRKWLIAGGVGVGGILLLAHGNSQASTGSGTGTGTGAGIDPNTGIPYAQESLAGAPGGFGQGGSTGNVFPPPPPSDITVNITGSRPKRKKPKGPGGKPGRRPGGHGPGRGKHPGAGKGEAEKDKDQEARKDKRQRTGHAKPGQNPNRKKHGSGNGKPKESTQIESPQGAGSGATIMGRQFPGATGHTISGARPSPAGGAHQTVKVHYGSHTETHVAHNGGRSWTDNVAGASPPSRRVNSPARRNTVR